MVRGMLVRMRLRGGAYQPESAETTGRPGVPAAQVPARGGVRRWRVSRKLLVAKGVAALGFGVVAIVSAGVRDRFVIACVAALLLAALAARDLLVGVRLEADAEGIIVVTGLAARHRVPWGAIQQIRVDQRQRIGLRTQLLEVDTDELLFLLGESDLGAPVVDVVEELNRLRVAARR
jgi:hypothetical protein